MKSSLPKMLPMLLGSIALTAQAIPIPISGQINIQAGSVILTPNVLGAVTGINGSVDGLVTSVQGSYPTSLDGDTVTYLPFAITVGAQPITSLWSVVDTVNGFNYSFNLVSITSVVQSPTNLFLNGTGVLETSNPAYSGTSGMWTYGINSSDGLPTNGIFSFQSNNSGAAVPDGGNAFILLGAGLLGVFGVCRKLNKSAVLQSLPV